jgi:hypothetical protein
MSKKLSVWSKSRLIVSSFLASTGQIILTPLFIDSFADQFHQPNPYFVMIFILSTEPIIYLPFAINKFKSFVKLPLKQHREIFNLSLITTLSYFMIMLSSSGLRTPVNLQSVLVQTNVPLTLFLSHFLLNKILTRRQIIGALMILFGISLTLIPNVIYLAYDQYDFHNILWSLVFITGMLFGSLSLVYTDLILERNQIDVVVINVWSGIYQFGLTVLFFPINLVPLIGTSNSFQEWSDQFMYASYRFSECSTPFYLGVALAVIIAVNSLIATTIIKYFSAGHLAMINSLSAPLSVSYWFLFPHQNQINFQTIVMNYIGCIIIIVSLFYINQRDYETLSDEGFPDADEKGLLQLDGVNGSV